MHKLNALTGETDEDNRKSLSPKTPTSPEEENRSQLLWSDNQDDTSNQISFLENELQFVQDINELLAMKMRKREREKVSTG